MFGVRGRDICTMPIDPVSLARLTSLVVLLTVVVLVLHEEVLISAVYSECYSGYSQAGEGVLESVESRELAGVSPCLSGIRINLLRSEYLVISCKLTLSPKGRISAVRRMLRISGRQSR